eukprot:g2892.t1
MATLQKRWLLLALLLVIVVPVDAAITCVKIKRWIEYVAICCCTCASILCSILVLFFLTNKSGGDDEDPWADFNPDENATNATVRLLSPRLLSPLLSSLRSHGSREQFGSKSKAQRPTGGRPDFQSTTMSITMSESAVKERFRTLDLDQDGVLDFDEFYSWISEDDCDMTRSKAKPIFDQVVDASGKVTFQEFVRCCKEFMNIEIEQEKPVEPEVPEHLETTMRAEKAEPQPPATNEAIVKKEPVVARKKVFESFKPPRKAATTESAVSENKIPGAHISRMAPPLPTPGPGAYNNTVKEKVPGGSYFGTGHITVGLDQSDASFTLSQEKQSFIKYDANKNGMLDFQELSKLLRKGDPFVTDTEVQALFHALDTDGDRAMGRSTFEHSTWRKKLRNAFQLSLPGPADYVGNDKNLAGKRNAPRPCAYTSTDTGSAFHKKTYSATFGSAPKIRDGRSESPGPGAYAQNFSALAHQKQGPRATIGAARRALCYDGSEEPSPGPATYATETKYKVKGGSYFGVPGRMNLPDLPYEKRAFASSSHRLGGMATDKELQLREELSRAAVDVAQCRAQLRSARQALSAAELREEELKAQLEDGDASYYEGHVKLAGFVEGLGKDDAFLTFRATGTQTDHMTELLADPQRRTFQLHVCEPSCGRRESGPDIIHAAGYWVVEDEEKKPWQTMYDEGPTKVGADDETGALRKLHEERKGADRREDKPPSEESEKKGKTKEKRKKKKQKEKLKKQEKEPGPKKGADIEEDSALLERGQKALSALYVGTCLDPDAETRSRLLKRAKRFGGRSSKKRRRSSSENTSSSSSSSETEEDEFGEGLFEERKRALRLTRRYPGSLAAQTVASMKESLLTQSGSLYAQDRKTLPPIFSQFYRSEMQALCSPSMSQELLTLSQGADLLLRGHPARALDLLAQRVKALDQLIRGGHWTVARQLELVSADSVGLSKGPEGQEAAKLAREELRDRLASQRPYGLDNSGDLQDTIHRWLIIQNHEFAAIAKDLPGFRQLFCKGLCSALGLPAHGNCVEVLNVTNGSIIDSRSAFELSQLLEKQLSSPYSALRRGPLGKFLGNAFLLSASPQTDAEAQTNTFELGTPRAVVLKGAAASGACTRQEEEEAMEKLREAVRLLQDARQRQKKAKDGETLGCRSSAHEVELGGLPISIRFDRVVCLQHWSSLITLVIPALSNSLTIIVISVAVARHTWAKSWPEIMFVAGASGKALVVGYLCFCCQTLLGMKLALQRFPTARWIVRAVDDTLIYPSQLAKELQVLDAQSWVYVGAPSVTLLCHMAKFEKQCGEVHAGGGGGVVLSRPLAETLLRFEELFLETCRHDDAFLGHFLRYQFAAESLQRSLVLHGESAAGAGLVSLYPLDLQKMYGLVPRLPRSLVPQRPPLDEHEVLIVPSLRQFQILFRCFAGAAADLPLPENCFFAGSAY